MSAVINFFPSRIPWLTSQTEKLNRLAVVGISALAVIGVSIHCDFQVAYACTIGGLDWHNIAWSVDLVAHFVLANR